ncbi:hypothetical protein ACFRIB_48205 [Streptomyces mirabilis]|uniref:hypothetical protein n=1 Tax=Streptomyces mirabilis TaxID=68239 RepID=UPI0036803FB1
MKVELVAVHGLGRESAQADQDGPGQHQPELCRDPGSHGTGELDEEQCRESAERREQSEVLASDELNGHGDHRKHDGPCPACSAKCRKGRTAFAKSPYDPFVCSAATSLAVRRAAPTGSLNHPFIVGAAAPSRIRPTPHTSL